MNKLIRTYVKEKKFNVHLMFHSLLEFNIMVLCKRKKS